MYKSKVNQVMNISDMHTDESLGHRAEQRFRRTPSRTLQLTLKPWQKRGMK